MTPTREAVEALVAEVWPELKPRHRNVYFREEQGRTVVEIRLEGGSGGSDRPPGLSYRRLKRLADFFGTDDIGDPDIETGAGCPTCDYGRAYEFTLRVRLPEVTDGQEAMEVE
jgi:hypothetical protein